MKQRQFTFLRWCWPSLVLGIAGFAITVSNQVVRVSGGGSVNGRAIPAPPERLVPSLVWMAVRRGVEAGAILLTVGAVITYLYYLGRRYRGL